VWEVLSMNVLILLTVVPNPRPKTPAGKSEES